NLLLVRGFSRRREVAVRLALGVSRRRLILQFLAEGLVLAALGAAGALLIANWTSHAVSVFLLGQSAFAGSALDGRLIGFTVAMTIATGVFTAIVPALSATRLDVAAALKAGAREGGGHHSPIRTALLVVQASLALLLLPGVRAVAVSVGLPFALNWTTELIVPGRPKLELRQEPAQYVVTPDYFKA